MPTLGITPGGRHEWITQSFGGVIYRIRKPIELSRIKAEMAAPAKPPRPIEKVGELYGFPVFAPKLSLGERAFAWLVRTVLKVITYFSK